MDTGVVGVVGNDQVTKDYDVHGFRRQVVDNAYLLAAIEFESETDRLASNKRTRTSAAQSGGDGTSVTNFPLFFCLSLLTSLPRAGKYPTRAGKHSMTDHIQARRRTKRLRK
jgi:hypothetical protein